MVTMFSLSKWLACLIFYAVRCKNTKETDIVAAITVKNSVLGLYSPLSCVYARLYSYNIDIEG